MNLTSFRDYIVPAFEGDMRHYAPAFAAFAALLLIGVVTLVLRRTQRSMRNVGTAFATSGLIGLLVYWFRYEGALYFDLDFWIWLVYAILALSIGSVLAIHMVRVPRQKELTKKQHIKSKYLPSRRR